jgi:hypothetical protein
LQQQVKAIIPICEIIFAKDKKFALLSQNYQRFGLDAPKAAPALPLSTRV